MARNSLLRRLHRRLAMMLAAPALLLVRAAAAQPEVMPDNDAHEAHDQSEAEEHSETQQHGDDHDQGHASVPLGGGWTMMGMAQVFPLVNYGTPLRADSPIERTRFHLSQPAAMINIESPNSWLALRLTPNFEGLTLPDGELTFGGWGEGFIDARHPHTIVHEAMLSLNVWDAPGGALSLSAGKGFAPYGTDDPMARPVRAYPTNHHLSQILERFTVNGVYLLGGWGVEAGIFGGAEPEGPYDFGNIESFPDSWSTRLSRRFGEGVGPMASWELTASYARVRESGLTVLYNAAARHAETYELGEVYALVEGSVSDSEIDGTTFAVLGETQIVRGRHAPYYRIEYSTRPEYEREGAAGTDEFFRYDHHDPAIGETRWLINSVGYGYRITDAPYSARVFVEAQHHHVWEERGGITPESLYGTNDLINLAVGLRIHFGGGPMRMGSYGVLDPMTAMHREMAAAGGHGEH